ncbi:M23 family metallopeptidase [Calothrix sp. 336/3]|uniref:M23 family metallopeptidase n=1 Tax=Calothrix sp. 336/3 TaxID=1337936 RepID=UPI000624477E|nr:M23 family metallopeptidase [Calothrix sp. 336/3]AKG24348.1 peptidase [Calothrix sp. 336/3]
MNSSVKFERPINRLHSTVAVGILAAIPLNMALPAVALQVQVSPPSPKLGDTISILINVQPGNSSGSPQVSVNGKSYPAYSISPNQYRAFLPSTPLEAPGKRNITVTGDGEVKNLSVVVGDRKFPVQRINLPPGKAGVKATEYELKKAAEFKALQTPEKYWQGTFLRPNKGRFSTGYGVRRYYNGKFAKDYYHRGLDFAGSAGSAVVAPAAGRVALVGTVSQGFRVHGNVVGIDHGQGITSIFMHLSRINVKEGDMVKPGQLIGAVGSTGASTGPHLHWGLYVNGLSIDPKPWLQKEFP